MSDLEEKLLFLNIKTIKQLDTELEVNKEKIVSFAKKWVKSAATKFNAGISIFYLCYVLVGQTNDLKFAKDYFEEVIRKGNSNITDRSQEIIETYNGL